MSYILDALKKAEAERRRGKGPDIMTEPDGSRREPERRPWIFALLIILAAAAGSAGWFLGHEKTDILKTASPQVARTYSTQRQSSEQPAPQTPTPAHPEQMQPQAQSQIQAQVSPTKPKTPFESAPALKEERATALEKKDVKWGGNDSTPAKSRATKTADKRKTPPVKPPADYTAGEVQPQPEKKNVPDSRTYAFNELPESVRQGLPSLIISTHIYSPEKTERLAAINGRIGREGQEIMPGVAVESITPDGAILRYQGYRFKVGLK
jgi:general secretion pathway protein B